MLATVMYDWQDQEKRLATVMHDWQHPYLLHADILEDCMRTFECIIQAHVHAHTHIYTVILSGLQFDSKQN